MNQEVALMHTCRAIFTGTFDTLMFFPLAVVCGSVFGFGIGYFCNDPCWDLDGAIGGFILGTVFTIRGIITGRFGGLDEDEQELLGLRTIWGGILGTAVAGGLFKSPVTGGTIGILCGLVASIPPHWSGRDISDFIRAIIYNMPTFFIQLMRGALKGLIIGLPIGLPFVLIGLFINSPEWIGIGAVIAIVGCAAGASVYPIQLFNNASQSKSDGENVADAKTQATHDATQTIIAQQADAADRNMPGELP